MAENISSPCSSTLALIRRTRTCGNKVRTGCVTCKIRHVKCDEQKPACQRCISSGRVCDGYVPVAPRKFHRHSRSTSKAKSRSHSPLTPTSSPQFDAYLIPTQEPMFDNYGADTNFEFWDDPISGSSCGSHTPMSSISSPFSSPSIPDLDTLDCGFDDMYLAPPLTTSQRLQPRSSPIPFYASHEDDLETFPQLLVLTSLDHAKQEFSSILQASTSLLPPSQIVDEYQATDQLAKQQHLSSRLHQFHSALNNYEIFNSSFHTASEVYDAKVLRIDVLGFYIYLATFLEKDEFGNNTLIIEFEEIVKLCEELVADGAAEGEWVKSLRQVALLCRDRGVKRRAVLLLSCCSTN